MQYEPWAAGRIISVPLSEPPRYLPPRCRSRRDSRGSTRPCPRPSLDSSPPNDSLAPPPLRFAPLEPCTASGTPAGAPWVCAEGREGETPPSGPAPPWHRPPPFVPRDPGAGQVYGRSPSGRTA